jgi:hypothetical protein
VVVVVRADTAFCVRGAPSVTVTAGGGVICPPPPPWATEVLESASNSPTTGPATAAVQA